MMFEVLFLIGLFSVATLMGSMIFFSGVMAPLIFIKLDEDTAGRFVRSIFPWYYLVIAGLSVVGTLSLFLIDTLSSLIILVIGIGAVLARQILMPRINDHRGKMKGGDTEAKTAFDRLHSLSVWINGAQVIGAIIVLVMLGSMRF